MVFYLVPALLTHPYKYKSIKSRTFIRVRLYFPVEFAPEKIPT